MAEVALDAPGPPSWRVRSVNGPRNNGLPIHTGEWTAEEIVYCDRLIEEFANGNVRGAEGFTLLAFLSEVLNCDPTRIATKYAGERWMRNVVYRSRDGETVQDDQECVQLELAELEQTYLERAKWDQRWRDRHLEAEQQHARPPERSQLLAVQSVGKHTPGSLEHGTEASRTSTRSSETSGQSATGSEAVTASNTAAHGPIHAPVPTEPRPTPVASGRIRRPQRGRALGDDWRLFTTDPVPRERIEGTCRHCGGKRRHHRKARLVRRHLLVCPQFCELMLNLPEQERPAWWYDKPGRRGR